MKLTKGSALIVVSSLGVFSSVFVDGSFERRAEAQTAETCTVSGITWQAPIAPPDPNVPNDLLLISCTDGTSYNAYVGTPGANTCYMDVDTVKSWEALAVAARITGNAVTIWWNTLSCPGNSSARIPISVTMN